MSSEAVSWNLWPERSADHSSLLRSLFIYSSGFVLFASIRSLSDEASALRYFLPARAGEVGSIRGPFLLA
jgi:hypothetical protein